MVSSMDSRAFKKLFINQNNGKRGQKGNLDNFGQVRTRQKIRKMGGKQKELEKGKKF